MHPVLTLLIGMMVVVGGIVYFRWHAFVALILASLCIAALTDRERQYQSQFVGVAKSIEAVDLRDGRLESAGIERLDLHRGQYVIVEKYAGADAGLVDASGPDGDLPTLEVVWSSDNVGQLVQASDDRTLLKASDQIVDHQDLQAIQASLERGVGDRVAAGFGDTCRKVGILIAMAAIIGQCLLRSGGAERIIQSICGILGDRFASVGFVISGFVLAIPVYFDTVFYLLIPLAKSLYRKTGRDYLLYVLSVIVGASMAHSLVPPTPGPLLVASELNIDLGVALPAGLIVGLIAAGSGFLFAVLSNRRWSVVPASQNQSGLRSPSEDLVGSMKPNLQDQASSALPSLGWSLLPIALPLVLIGLGVDWALLFGDVENLTPPTWLRLVIEFVSDKNIALTLSALTALILMIKSPRRDETPIASDVQKALSDAGSIILITAAGGSLGQVIRETGIASVLANWMPTAAGGIGLLVVAFASTTLIRFVQGSATVAMITAVGIVGPLAGQMDLSFHPVYLFLAIGCGSKPLPWMNDSGFWVIGRMSEMTPTETLKSFSATLTVMGCVGLVVTLLGAILFPLR